jgi:hypothetical protein
MWPIGCPETSVRNYHHALRNIAEEGRSELKCSTLVTLSFFLIPANSPYTNRFVLCYLNCNWYSVVSFLTTKEFCSDCTKLYLEEIQREVECCISDFSANCSVRVLSSWDAQCAENEAQCYCNKRVEELLQECWHMAVKVLKKKDSTK